MYITTVLYAAIHNVYSYTCHVFLLLLLVCCYAAVAVAAAAAAAAAAAVAVRHRVPDGNKIVSLLHCIRFLCVLSLNHSNTNYFE